jgi:hypothetical protein
MFLAIFKKDQQGVVTRVKEITLSPIKDRKDKKVMANKPNVLDSDVANAIDGAVSASLNNKFDAMSQNLEKMLVTHMSQMRLLLILESRLVVLVMTPQICKFLNFLCHLKPQ